MGIRTEDENGCCKFRELQSERCNRMSPADVREFLLTVLPGHPCADFFTYTSGYVLCSLDKEDLRRQARDDEAANVIWAELKGCRLAAAAAPGSQFEATQQRGGLVGPPTVTVYV